MGWGVMLPFARSSDGVLVELDSSRHGLSTTEADRRLFEVGPNVLPEVPPPGVAVLFVRQFASPFIYILLAAAGLSVVLQEWSDAIFIGVVVVLNALIGTLQEARAERSAHALRQMMTTTARVVRDGDVVEIDASLIVPGDMVMLASGDKVPADVRLVDEQDLRVDESLLTGESLPVSKDADAVLPPDAGLIVLLATVIAGLGLLMTPLGWGWAAFVWGYALFWFLIEDRVKLAAYVYLDRHSRLPRASSPTVLSAGGRAAHPGLWKSG